MGLFKDTKQFIYRIGMSTPPMKYDAFVDAFRDYVKTEEFASILKDNGFSAEVCETDYTPYTGVGDASAYPYKMKMILLPYGNIEFTTDMRGPKQGLSLIFYSLKITGEFKSQDKKWFIAFCKAIHVHYETVFASLHNGKGTLFDFSKYNY